jgi:MFS superfamily sulfate permease-like transporter
MNAGTLFVTAFVEPNMLGYNAAIAILILWRQFSQITRHQIKAQIWVSSRTPYEQSSTGQPTTARNCAQT